MELWAAMCSLHPWATVFIDETGRTWFTQNFGKYDIPATPTLIDAPVTMAGKSGFTANWTARAGEDVTEYRVDLRSSNGSLLQTQTVKQPTVTFTGLAVQTDYTVEVTARAIDTPGLVYPSATRTFTVTTLQDLPESTPSAVTFTDVDGTQNDTFTIPAVAGVDYLVGGSIVPAGTYRGAGTVVVTAQAKADFVLDPAAPASWSATFKSGPHNVTPAPVTFSDVDGTHDDTYTVPWVAGVDYMIGDLVVGPGTYPGTGTVVVTAQAKADFVLARRPRVLVRDPQGHPIYGDARRSDVQNWPGHTGRHLHHPDGGRGRLPRRAARSCPRAPTQAQAPSR